MEDLLKSRLQEQQELMNLLRASLADLLAVFGITGSVCQSSNAFGTAAAVRSRNPATFTLLR